MIQKIFDHQHVLTPEQIQTLREKLLQRRWALLKTEATNELDALTELSPEQVGEITHPQSDLADKGARNSEQALLFKLVEHEAQAVRNIDDSLRKIHNYQYGYCDDCGDPIPYLRLCLVPEARRCIGCEESHETRRHHPVIVRRPIPIAS